MKDKLLNIGIVLGISFVLGLIIFFTVHFIGMIIDHKCQELPVSEFYSNKMCKPYWKGNNK